MRSLIPGAVARQRRWPAICMGLATLLALSPARAWTSDDDPVLAGSVVDPRGVPVVGARILLLPWSVPSVSDHEVPVGTVAQAITDEAGNFRVRRSELARPVARTEEFVRAWARKGGLTSGRSVLRLGGGQALGLRFELRESLNASIVVETEGGLPIARADVVLDLSDLKMPPGGDLGMHYRIAITTDENGEGRIVGLPEAAYGEARVRVSTAERTTTTEAVDLQQQERSLRVRVVVPSVVQVAGVLRESDGRPAEGLRVVDWNGTWADWSVARLAAANESGRFLLADVPRTTRTLLILARPQGKTDDHIAPLPPTLIDVVPVDLTRAVGMTDLGELRLPARRRVRITVVDRDHRLLKSRVMLQREGVGFGAASRSTNASGWVEFEDVSRVGPYVIEVRADSARWGEIEQWFPLASSGDAQTVCLTGGGMLIVRFFSSAQPDQRVKVDAPTIRWIGRSPRGATEMAEVHEHRMWVGANESGYVEVLAAGVAKAVSETVSTRAEEPTIVNVLVRKE